MKSSSRSLREIVLIVAAIAGLVTVGSAWYGLWHTHKFAMTVDFEGFVRLVFYSAAVLAFETPDGLDENVHWAWSVARIGAVVFSVGTIGSILYELAELNNNLVRRFVVQFERRVRRKKPAILLGLGWIGGPLASELRDRSKVVYAAVIDDQQPGVEALRRSGAIVVAGDATATRTQRALPLRKATEAFIATGDDEKNVEVAGTLLDAAEKWGRKSALNCYVHIANPTFAEMLTQQEIWRIESDYIKLIPFSYQDLAARDLFFGKRGLLSDHDLLPSSKEPFHLIVVGFGIMGQSVARHMARFGHFASLGRPRMTVYAESRKDVSVFHERYPAFAPPNLRLTKPSLRLPGADAWNNSHGRPTARRHRLPDEALALGAIEYAVNAEFLDLPDDLGTATLADQVLDRAAPLQETPDGPLTRVRLAVVVCLEEERASFEAALRLQHALTVAQAERDGEHAPIPVYVHVPEQGLDSVIMKTDQSVASAKLSHEHRHRDRQFPVRVFGVRDEVASYERITAQRAQNLAKGHRSLYETLAPLRALHVHLDFASSDLDAALHAQAKGAVLGIQFHDPRTEGQPEHAVRVLAPLVDPAIDQTVKKLLAKFPSGVPHEELMSQQSEVRGRLALASHVAESSDPADQNLVVGILDEVVALMHEELAAHGHDPNLPAKMEHNRWMGERLLKGWRYGERDNTRRQRITFVPWSKLTERDRRHDELSLPRIVIEAHEKGIESYWVTEVG